MKIIISGGSGLVGKQVIRELSANGHETVQMVRRTPETGQYQWDPTSGTLDPELLESADGVIHLGGENIAEGRWTASRKERIRTSRIVSTQRIAETLASIADRPRFLLCASAIGYYGNRNEEFLTESSAAGDDFLARLCQDWEAATRPALDAGVRVVNLRIGVVLTRQGGALAKMLTPFRLGLGGVVGSGNQYWSSVSRTELGKIITFCAETDTIDGPVNAVNPCAVTNRDFTRTLGRQLGRPTLVPLPRFVAKTLLGEMAQPLLLYSTRVVPEKLLTQGYKFMFSDLDSILAHELQIAS